jgi:hypothetical protein
MGLSLAPNFEPDWHPFMSAATRKRASYCVGRALLTPQPAHAAAIAAANLSTAESDCRGYLVRKVAPHYRAGSSNKGFPRISSRPPPARPVSVFNGAQPEPKRGCRTRPEWHRRWRDRYACPASVYRYHSERDQTGQSPFSIENLLRQCLAISMPRQNHTRSKLHMCSRSLIKPPHRPGRPISRS